jgi:hypothetical protein
VVRLRAGDRGAAIVGSGAIRGGRRMHEAARSTRSARREGGGMCGVQVRRRCVDGGGVGAGEGCECVCVRACVVGWQRSKLGSRVVRSVGR